MGSRFLAMGTAVIIAAALVACGGGGGGGGGVTPATPTPFVTPTPTPTPTINPYGCVGSSPFALVGARRPMANPPHPIAPGNTFTYSGSLSKTYTQSAPCAQPTATTAATVGVQVSDSSTTSPGGAATDQQSVETDAFPTQTMTTTTDDVLQNTSSEFLLYSTTSKDSIGNTIATDYASAQVLDKIPEQSGQSWGPNDPAASMTETLADGTSVSRTTDSDGSYTDTETYADGSTSKITIDGAANGKTRDGGGTYELAGSTFTYGPPTNGTITLTIASTPPKTRSFPAWFSVPSGSYISDTFVDNGSVAFDASCNVNPAIGTSGNQIVESYSVLDPILGYIDKRVTTSYVVPGFGAACVKIADTLDSYYDYQNDTTKIDYQSQNGQPNSVSQIVEFLSMQKPSSPYSAVRRALSAVSPLAVASRSAAIDHERAVEIAQRAEALHRFALAFGRRGGVR